MQDFAKNIENINNQMLEGFKKLDSFLMDSNIDQSTKDKIIVAREGLKEAIKGEDTNKIFETINNFNK